MKVVAEAGNGRAIPAVAQEATTQDYGVDLSLVRRTQSAAREPLSLEVANSLLRELSVI